MVSYHQWRKSGQVASHSESMQAINAATNTPIIRPVKAHENNKDTDNFLLSR